MINFNYKRFYISIFFFIFFLKFDAQTLKEAFFLAGNNKENLMYVLDHYKVIGEEEKYQAALFLIKNMSPQESHTYKWISNNGKVMKFSELDYEDSDLAYKAFKRLKDSFNIIRKKVITKDIKVITSKELIRNIDHAFDAWKNNKWSQSYTFEIFCEYILPHRSIIEPLEPWREECAFLVRKAKYGLEKDDDPVEVCNNVMNTLKDFSFVSKNMTIPSPLLGTEQLLFRREGSCPELANLAVLASRSIGLAVTFDFTPHHGASSNRHFWNTVIDKHGTAIPFNGSSASDVKGMPYNYNPNNKRISKVFRRTYSIQNIALASKFKKEEIPDSFLRNKNIIDVTKDYVPVGVITDKFIKKNSVSVAYLNVFNNGKWRIVDWAAKKGKRFIFKNIGRDLVYLPNYYLGNQKIYSEYPILLNTKGESTILKPNYNKLFECTLSRDNEYKNRYVDENNSLYIEANEKYRLLYWDKSWKEAGVETATRLGIHFKKLPSNALFLLLPLYPDGYERIFTINSKTAQIVWY